jgi:hypothetical protein
LHGSGGSECGYVISYDEVTLAYKRSRDECAGEGDDRADEQDQV